LVEIAATDAGLVGHYNDRPPQLIGPETSQLENARNELELFRPMDIAAVHVDDAIPVKKKGAGGHTFSPQSAANRDICHFGALRALGHAHELSGLLAKLPAQLSYADEPGYLSKMAQRPLELDLKTPSRSDYADSDIRRLDLPFRSGRTHTGHAKTCEMHSPRAYLV
jgi:hypothetical protein